MNFQRVDFVLLVIHHHSCWTKYNHFKPNLTQHNQPPHLQQPRIQGSTFSIEVQSTEMMSHHDSSCHKLLIHLLFLSYVPNLGVSPSSVRSHYTLQFFSALIQPLKSSFIALASESFCLMRSWGIQLEIFQEDQLEQFLWKGTVSGTKRSHWSKRKWAL